MIVFLFLVLAVRDFSSLRTHFRPFICVHRSSTKEKSRERFRKNEISKEPRIRLRQGYGVTGDTDVADDADAFLTKGR
jgi:hypothetical protein